MSNVRPFVPIRAALFDLDDTLHDKSATLRSVADRQFVEAGLADLGIAQTEWQARFVELNNRRIEKPVVFAALARTFELPTTLQQYLLADFDATLGREAVAFPGAVELLQACKARGLKVGVVTNGRDAFQRSKISGMGLLPYIDAVVTSGAFGRKKPDPAIFWECLRQLEAEPGQAVFIGDDLSADIEPSVKLGMRAICKSPLPAPGAWLSSDSLHEISAHLHAQA
jgi:HAD superfamily hydrolase (TIGR01509 family)